MPSVGVGVAKKKKKGGFIRFGKSKIDSAFLKNFLSFPHGSVGKESACNAGDPAEEVSIPVSERSPGGRHGYPLQYSCLENPMDRGLQSMGSHRVRHNLATKPPTIGMFNMWKSPF